MIVILSPPPLREMHRAVLDDLVQYSLENFAWFVCFETSTSSSVSRFVFPFLCRVFSLLFSHSRVVLFLSCFLIPVSFFFSPVLSCLSRSFSLLFSHPCLVLFLSCFLIPFLLFLSYFQIFVVLFLSPVSHKYSFHQCNFTRQRGSRVAQWVTFVAPRKPVCHFAVAAAVGFTLRAPPYLEIYRTVLDDLILV